MHSPSPVRGLHDLVNRGEAVTNKEQFTIELRGPQFSGGKVGAAENWWQAVGHPAIMGLECGTP